MKRNFILFMGLILLWGGFTAVTHPSLSHAAPTADAVVGTGTLDSC